MRDERRHLIYEVVRRAERGESQRGTARALSIAPKTIRAILQAQAERRLQGESAVARKASPTRSPRASKLDGYEEQIGAWLEIFPDLTAVRLQEMLAEAGFGGGYTIVRQYLKDLRGRAKPKLAVQVVETVVGLQAQFDWSPYRIETGDQVQVWSCTLSWSRARSFLASDNLRQTTILRSLVTSFEAFGGVPAECVTDSMPGVVDRWEAGRPILNVRFVDFAAYYRFAVHIAPRADGAYKGKVERPFRYVDDNFLNGRKFHSRAEFAEALAWWTTHRAMQRPHPETKRPIHEMLAEERPFLKTLPARPYDTRDVVIRVVDETAHVQVETNFYPVPDRLIGELVYVCLGQDRVEIVDRGIKRVAECERLPDGAGRRLADPDRQRRRKYDHELLIERVSAWGPAAGEFARRLRERRHFSGPDLQHLLGLQMQWSADDIVGALEHAMPYDAYDARAVERILTARYAPWRLDEQIAESTRGRIREVMRDHPVAQRPLASYETLRNGDPPRSAQEEESHDDPNRSGEQS